MEQSYDARHFSTLSRYNRMANEVLYSLVASLPAEAIGAPRGSYFDSIEGILRHTLTCDINWLRRFRGVFPELHALKSPRLEPRGALWINYEFGPFGELAEQRVLVDRLLDDFVGGAPLDRLDAVLSYADSHGTPRRYFFRDALDHVFNHQTHHRGQVSQILDELKVEHDFSNLLDACEIPVE